MKKFILLAAIFLQSVNLFAQTPKHANVSYINATTKSPYLISVGYMELLPYNYSDTTKKFPLIVFLHGSGERGLGTDLDLAKVKTPGPLKFIKPSTNNFIILCPQTNKWSWKGDVIPFVKWTFKNYRGRIDTTKVYLTGLSMGGEGTWQAAADPSNSPNLFTAIAPVCGRASRAEGGLVASRGIYVWAFHGSSDTSIPIEGDWNPIAGYRAVNTTKIDLSIYPRVSHNCWDRAYRIDHLYESISMYEWFNSKTKK